MRLELIGLGDTILDRDLLRFADHLALPIAALETVGELLREAIQRQFDTQGERASGGWKPLAASTVAEKARRGLDPRILRATERLMRSLTEKYDPEHTEEPLSPDTLRFGTTVDYAIYHQTGTSRMPARPPVALTETDRVAMVKAVQLELIAGVRAAGSAAERLANRSSFYRGAIA